MDARRHRDGHPALPGLRVRVGHRQLLFDCYHEPPAALSSADEERRPGLESAGDYVFLREIGRGPHGRVFLARTPPRVDIPDPPGRGQGAPGPGGPTRGLDALLRRARGCSPMWARRSCWRCTTWPWTAAPPSMRCATRSWARSRRPRARCPGVSGWPRPPPRAAHAAARAARGRASCTGRSSPATSSSTRWRAALAEPGRSPTWSSHGQPLTGISTRAWGFDLELVDLVLDEGRPGWSGQRHLGAGGHPAPRAHRLRALPGARCAGRPDGRGPGCTYGIRNPEPDADLSDGERAIVMRALQPDPAARYATAEELAQDIERVAG